MRARCRHFGERGSVAPEDRDAKATEKIQMAVLMRDGFRCLICKSPRRPRAHHLTSRANGGKTLVEFMGTFCSSCHTLLHEGTLRVNWDDECGLIATDADGKPQHREGGPAELLEDSKLPLMVLKRRQAKKEEIEALAHYIALIK